MKKYILTTAFVAGIIATVNTADAATWPIFHSESTAVVPSGGRIYTAPDAPIIASAPHARALAYGNRTGDKVLNTTFGSTVVNEYDMRRARPETSHVAAERAGAFQGRMFARTAISR